MEMKIQVKTAGELHPSSITSMRINQYSGKESASERGSMEDHPRGHPSSCDITLKEFAILSDSAFLCLQ